MSNIIDKIQLSGVTYDIGGQGGSGVSVVEVTQAEYDALPSSAKTDTSKMYVITDAQAGDLTNYYTKTQTNTLLGGKADTATTYTKTEVDNAITAATSTKQDTLVSGTNIKTINSQSLLGSGNIVIQGGSGGGKAIEAGRGISITTGETADTVSFNLPISAGTNNLDNITCCGSNTVSGQYAVSFGDSNTAKSSASATFGRYCTTNNYDNFAAGYRVVTKGNQASAFGTYTKTENDNEHSVGKYNVSNKANGTWGDSGNTLFSVGNGTADNARHNAFEIRQNGDIYLSSGGTDIKLQDHLGGGGSSINVVQTTGSSTTDVMSQAAVTNIIGDIETLLSNI